jgi:hypothetical protein
MPSLPLGLLPAFLGQSLGVAMMAEADAAADTLGAVVEFPALIGEVVDLPLVVLGPLELVLHFSPPLDDSLEMPFAITSRHHKLDLRYCRLDFVASADRGHEHFVQWGW